MSSSLLRFLKNPFFVPILGDKSILLINVNRSRVRFIIDIQLYFKVLFTSWLESDSTLFTCYALLWVSQADNLLSSFGRLAGSSSSSWRSIHQTTDRQVFKLVQRNAKEDGGSREYKRAANNIHVQKVLSFISLGLLIMDLAGIERKDFSYVQIYYLKSRACHHHHHRHHHGHGSKKTFFEWNFPQIFFSKLWRRN